MLGKHVNYNYNTVTKSEANLIITVLERSGRIFCTTILSFQNELPQDEPLSDRQLENIAITWAKFIIHANN